MTRSLTARRCETARASSVAEMTEVGKATHVGNCGVGGGGDVEDFLKRFPNLNPFCLRSGTTTLKLTNSKWLEDKIRQWAVLRLKMDSIALLRGY